MTHATHPTDPVTEALIGEIAEDFTQQLAQGQQPQVESYVARYPEYEEVLRQVLPALQAIQPHQLPGDIGTSESLGLGGRASVNRVLGDFRLLREIGRGGMGIVYECEQLSLQRRVALKVLPLASVFDERRLQRFRNEALAAAQLNHPHIVDVLGVGSERGVHYYAMRYIEGRTVADLISAERDTDNGDRPASTVSAARPADDVAATETRPIAGLSTEGQRSTPERFRRLTEMFADIADALDHAHQHGIVHRDVKPSNLIIDQAGKIWICDFGLAQIDNGAAGLTRTGDLIGTLRFLSPEQVDNRNLVIDGRVDVYALGATLYETMTLQPAFDAETRPELLKQIITSEPKSPRKIDPAIPAELETLVLKAMTKCPHERYETAGELADDLRRFATDKPIQARRPSLKQRLARWARHHRGIVLMSAALTFLVAIGCGIAAVVIDSARRDAVASKNRAEHSAELANREWTKAERLRVREEKNFRSAMRAVDLMLTRVAESKLVTGPGMLEERREMLHEALKIYRQFLAQRNEDSDVRLETVRAYERVGKILLLLGRLKEARVAYQNSIRFAERGVGRKGANRYEYRVQHAVAHHNLGMIAFAHGNLKQAETHYGNSVAIFGALPTTNKQSEVVRTLRAGGHNNLGNVLYQRGNRKAAVGHYRKSIEEFQKLRREFGSKAKHCRSLATAHCSYARYLLTAGRIPESYRHFSTALKLQKAMVEQLPAVTTYRRELARTYGSLGGVQHKLRQIEKAQDSFRNAIAIQSALMPHYSDVPDFLNEVARVHNTYSFLLRALRKRQLALAHSRKALKLRTQLAADHPKTAKYQLNLARSRRHVAIHLASTDSEEAGRLFGDSIGALSKLIKSHPHMPLYPAELAESHLQLGRFQRESKKPEEAEQSLRSAIIIFSKLKDSNHIFPRHRIMLVKARRELGVAHAKRKEYRPAADLFALNVRDMRTLVEMFPESESQRRGLCGCLHNLGLAQFRLSNFAAADSLFRENLTTYASLMRQSTQADRCRTGFRKSLLQWGGMLNMRKQRPTDGIGCLAIASYAWKRGNTRLTKLWLQRALTKSTRDRVVFDRILVEVRLMTGLRAKSERAPVSAVKPKAGRPRG